MSEHAPLLRRVTTASVAVAVVLILAKTVAWGATGSVSLLSSLVDSLLDVGASLVNFFALRAALTPADREHRFGHGKAEPLAGLAQAAFICGSALFLVVHAVDRITHPRPLEHGSVGIAVMLGSMLLTAALVLYQRRVVRITGSLVVKADALHYVVDLASNAVVVVALLLAARWPLADPLLSLGIAVYIVHAAWEVGRDALDMLMDRELPEAERGRILELANADPGVVDAHALRTRTAGQKVFIQLHLGLDGEQSLNAAHDAAVRVATKLRAAYPDADVLIHQDPAGLDEADDH